MRGKIWSILNLLCLRSVMFVVNRVVVSFSFPALLASKSMGEE